MSTEKTIMLKEAEKRLFVHRLKQAIWRYGKPPRKALSQAELGKLVGELLGRSFSQATVGGWLKGSLPADLGAMVALARALEVDPGWLYFGEHSDASAPGDDEPAPRLPSRGGGKRLLPDDEDINSEVA